MTFPAQPFGFVAGRWVRSIADTPDDPDRAPDYIPVETGVVLFTPQVTHRVAPDNSGWAGIIKDQITARLGARGQLVDAEGHDHLALALGVYSVSYDFGSGNSWPSHYIEVRQEHTAGAPLWLPPIAPPPVGPMIENRVVTIPADGQDGQVLVWDGAGFSWADPPKGDKGDTGDLEFMSGTRRIVNLALGREFETSGYNNHYKSPPIGITEGDIVYTHRVYSNDEGASHGVIGSIVILASDTIHTWLVGAWRPESSDNPSKFRRVEITSSVPEDATIAFYGDFEAPALFSDINIINLTQVYGAGNEPSLEYMDALVEKHGGYIDGEQYSVGDALRELTVVGPGLALRYDNSVGERLFSDHPGGSTLIYGATGWRDVESLLEPGWELASSVGRFWLRLTTHTIDLYGRIRVTPDAPFIGMARTGRFTIVTLPAGFRVNTDYVPTTIATVGNTPIVIETDGPNRVTVVGEGTWAAGDGLVFTMSVPRFSIDWPTALPGTPL